MMRVLVAHVKVELEMTIILFSRMKKFRYSKITSLIWQPT